MIVETGLEGFAKSLFGLHHCIDLIETIDCIDLIEMIEMHI